MARHHPKFFIQFNGNFLWVRMTPPAKRVKSNNDQHFRDSRESATVEIHEELRTMPCPISLSKVRLISLSRAETRVRMTPEVVVGPSPKKLWSQWRGWVMLNGQISVRYIASQLGISNGSVATILHDHLNFSKVSARWVPRMPTPWQKRNQIMTSTEVLTPMRTASERFTARFVSPDETSVPRSD